MDSEKVTRFINMLQASDNAVFFGGAGVSTESGVPDFRSKDGLYNQHDVRFDEYSPEYLLSHTCLVRQPEVFFEFYRQKMDSRGVQPNAAHLFLAKLEEMGKLRAVVTQNIDGLHQKAGSNIVYEIHGTTGRNYCASCGRSYPADFIFDSTDAVPRCECGGIVRCDVTLYEESLPQKAVEGAIEAISRADLLIVGGTSLTVYPAASYVNYFRGSRLVVINRQKLYISASGAEVLEVNEPIGAFFSAAAAEMGLRI